MFKATAQAYTSCLRIRRDARRRRLSNTINSFRRRES